MVISVSTRSRSWRCLPRRSWPAGGPRSVNGLVTTPTVSAPELLADLGDDRRRARARAAAHARRDEHHVRVAHQIGQSARRSLRPTFSPTFGLPPAPRPRVSFSPMWMRVGASERASAWVSVLTATNSTPRTPAWIMRLTALLPPPPTPRTTMRAAPSRLVDHPFIVNTVLPRILLSFVGQVHANALSHELTQGRKFRSQFVTALPIFDSGMPPRRWTARTPARGPTSTDPRSWRTRVSRSGRSARRCPVGVPMRTGAWNTSAARRRMPPSCAVPPHSTTPAGRPAHACLVELFDHQLERLFEARLDDLAHLPPRTGRPSPVSNADTSIMRSSSSSSGSA